jgi:nicotinamidase-related amidase
MVNVEGVSVNQSETYEVGSIGAYAGRAWQFVEGTVNLSPAPSTSRTVRLPAVHQPIECDLQRTVMVIVDMQNDFCHEQGWLASIGVDIAAARGPIEPLVGLLPRLRSNGVPIIWLNWGTRSDRANLPPNIVHVYDPEGRGVGIGAPLGGTGHRVLEAGSWGAQIVDELVPEESDIHVDKHRMSGFFDTSLDSILRNLDARTLLFAGVNLDQCVLHTLADAACLGYDCVLLDDCSATTSPAFCADAARYNIAQCFGFTVSSIDLEGALT